MWMMPKLREEGQRVRELADADEVSAEESASLRRAIVAKFEAQYASPVCSPMPWRIAWGSAAVLTVIVTVLFLTRESSTKNGWRVLSGTACVHGLPNAAQIRPECSEAPVLELGRARVTVAAGSLLVHTERGVRVERGHAVFKVKHVPTESAYEVRVSDGTIVVVGTRFTVEQGPQGGSVAVEEGAVEIHWDNGNTSPTRVAAGQEAHWPHSRSGALAPDTAELSHHGLPPDLPAGPSPQSIEPSQLSKERDAKVVLRHLFQLLSQHRYDEAEALLGEASADRNFTVLQRERFGFELGSLLNEEGKTAAACAHWRDHLAKYPDSPRADFIRQALLHCPTFH
jgi:hypothetical protein